MSHEPSDHWRPWFYAAAVYNLAWGAWVIVAPTGLFDLLGIARPAVLPLWQVVGLLVLIWAPGYFWVARHPDRQAHLILLAMAGKVLGPIGYALSVATGALPVVFGLTILTNDVVWWPAFGGFLRQAAARHGGWQNFLMGG